MQLPAQGCTHTRTHSQHTHTHTNTHTHTHTHTHAHTQTHTNTLSAHTRSTHTQHTQHIHSTCTAHTHSTYTAHAQHTHSTHTAHTRSTQQTHTQSIYIDPLYAHIYMLRRCFADFKPRTNFDACQAAILANLAEMVVRQVEKDVLLQTQRHENLEAKKVYTQVRLGVRCVCVWVVKLWRKGGVFL